MDEDEDHGVCRLPFTTNPASTANLRTRTHAHAHLRHTYRPHTRDTHTCVDYACRHAHPNVDVCVWDASARVCVCVRGACTCFVSEVWGLVREHALPLEPLLKGKHLRHGCTRRVSCTNHLYDYVLITRVCIMSVRSHKGSGECDACVMCGTCMLTVCV